jgi:cell division protein FtsB
MQKFFIISGLTIYTLILMFIFVDLVYVFRSFAVHTLQTIPLALGVELLAAYFSFTAIYYRKLILKIIALSFGAFVWFLVMTATTKLWTDVSLLSVAITIFVPFANLVLPSIIAYILSNTEYKQVQLNLESANNNNEETPRVDAETNTKKNGNISFDVIATEQKIKALQQDKELVAKLSKLKRLLSRYKIIEFNNGSIYLGVDRKQAKNIKYLTAEDIKKLDGVKIVYKNKT